MIVTPMIRRLTTHSVLYAPGARETAMSGDPGEAEKRAARWRRLALADALDSHRPAMWARAAWWQSIADAQTHAAGA